MKQFSIDFLSTLQTVPNSCVYAIISDSSMKCFISHSNNLQTSLASVLASNKVIGNDVRLVVLDILEDKEYKLLLAEKWKSQYRLNGYDVVNKRSYINYYVRIQYSRSLHSAMVVLYNKRRDKKIVGVFDNINEARSFVAEYYSEQGDCTFPVYSTNEGTKEYMERKIRDDKKGRNLA